MDVVLLVIIFAGCLGGLLAWSIGANDVANSFGTSVGSRALTVWQAVFIAAVFEFAGAELMGAHVTGTFKDGIVDLTAYDGKPHVLMLGMTATMMGAALMLILATAFSLPISGTHSVVGGMIGFALVSGAADSVRWGGIIRMVAGWLLSPVLAGASALALFACTRLLILRTMQSYFRSLVLFSPAVATVVFLNLFVIFWEGQPAGIDLRDVGWYWVLLACWITGMVCGAVAAAALPYLRRFVHSSLRGTEYHKEPGDYDTEMECTDEESVLRNRTPQRISDDFERDVGGTVGFQKNADGMGAKSGNGASEPAEPTRLQAAQEDSCPIEKFDPRSEQVFGVLQVLMAMLLSFAHGANDVANAIGPIAICYEVFRYDKVVLDAPVLWWMLLIASVLLVAGLFMWGYRVMLTIGTRIAELTKTRGFSIEFGSALTVILGTRLGLPLSTTHCKVGAVVGVGLGDGVKAVNPRVLIEIAVGWAVTVPLAAGVSALCYLVLDFTVLPYM